jgi:hypothetical protein
MKLIDQFLIKLRQLAEPCNFGTLEDEMVRDRLVLGSQAVAVRQFRWGEGKASSKGVFSPLLGQNFRKFVNFP